MMINFHLHHTRVGNSYQRNIFVHTNPFVLRVLVIHIYLIHILPFILLLYGYVCMYIYIYIGFSDAGSISAVWCRKVVRANGPVSDFVMYVGALRKATTALNYTSLYFSRYLNWRSSGYKSKTTTSVILLYWKVIPGNFFQLLQN